MHESSDTQPRADDVAQRREYRRYLAHRMGPMIHALMLVAAAAYVVAVAASVLVRTSPVPLWLRLTPAVPLLLVAMAARYVRQPRLLSALSLLCVLLVEIGINISSLGHPVGQHWIPPGLLLPVATSVMWMGRWDFAAAMALCALGPLPILLIGPTEAPQLMQYTVYMTIAVSLAAVLRAFMARTLFEQFRLERQLREQAYTDGLTGLLQRNRFLELARLALEDIRQQQEPACVMYLDADHFKPLNDDYGHAAGDAALVALAATMRRHLRPDDLIGRIGGEEFAVLLPGLGLYQAGLRAEKLRLAMHAVTRPDGHLTVSIGIVERSNNQHTIETLLARADHAMRQAKAAGRDRVVAAS